MFNDKPKEGGSGIKLPKPEVETPYGTLSLGRVGKGVGIKLTKKFSEGGKAKDSARTKMLKEAEVDDDLGGIKRIIKSGLVKGSELLDRAGLRQDKEYENKTKEQLEVKKARGGKVKKYQAGGMTTAGNALTGLNVTNPAQNPDPFAISYGQQQQTPNVMEGNNDNVNVGTSNEASSYMYRRGGKVKTYKSGGAVKASSASKRADGCAIKGKTRGRMV